MKKKILIVDDSATVRNLMDTTLTDAGYSVMLAEDETDALHLVGDNKYDLLMTDLNMPKMDGIQFTSEVRKIPGKRFTPIIILSSESRQSRRKECTSAGASGYLQKPFNQDQILGILRMIVPH